MSVLLQYGAEGVDRDAIRAKELYERPIREGDHINSMHNLAHLLKTGAEGIEKNEIRANELLERTN